MATAHTTIDPASSRVRVTRSARAPTGMVAAAPTRVATALSNPMPVLLMSNERCRSAAVAPTVPLSAPSNASTAARIATTRSCAGPPTKVCNRFACSPSATGLAEFVVGGAVAVRQGVGAAAFGRIEGLLGLGEGSGQAVAVPVGLGSGGLGRGQLSAQFRDPVLGGRGRSVPLGRVPARLVASGHRVAERCLGVGQGLLGTAQLQVVTAVRRGLGPPGGGGGVAGVGPCFRSPAQLQVVTSSRR